MSGTWLCAPVEVRNLQHSVCTGYVTCSMRLLKEADMTLFDPGY
jgi:hypothetical protein